MDPASVSGIQSEPWDYNRTLDSASCHNGLASPTGGSTMPGEDAWDRHGWGLEINLDTGPGGTPNGLER